MVFKNTSDNIEEYIKQILAQAGMAELKRSELADIFHVVPSQINYVIKTRFTESRGYVVESKRGGGGYIRIGKVTFSDQHEMMQELLEAVTTQISTQVFEDLLYILLEEGLASQREVDLMLLAGSDAVLGQEAPVIRARMLRKWLQQLDRKGTS